MLCDIGQITGRSIAQFPYLLNGDNSTFQSVDMD